ncbi:MAG: enoyl-CoA hydratase-related protein [Bacteroidales bacterium]|jgi:enoyl-CoA hydratase|nr:enoyl-CoA hydratase-related protein [Bacteroidales bacterium]MDD3272643.1 enoyl-CoA hydratase-related protein [Bacteroidales bacterium]
MNLQFVSLYKEDHIGIITINNPSALNALNSTILSELSAVLDKAEEDDEILAIIITGEGRAFVAGADIQEMANLSSAEGEAFGKRGTDLFRRIETAEKPVIAAVNGFALGGGCELAISCDIRIASENAKFGQPEVGLGITPGFGGTVRMTKLIGPAKAKELIFSGRVIDAAEALSIGLVNKIVQPSELMSTALQMANSFASKAPIAVRLSKKIINYATDFPTEESTNLENRLFGSCFSTSDQKEGMEAFLQKRKPEFKNR